MRITKLFLIVTFILSNALLVSKGFAANSLAKCKVDFLGQFDKIQYRVEVPGQQYFENFEITDAEEIRELDLEIESNHVQFKLDLSDRNGGTLLYSYKINSDNSSEVPYSYNIHKSYLGAPPVKINESSRVVFDNLPSEGDLIFKERNIYPAVVGTRINDSSIWIVISCVHSRFY